jgi:hypothetical protein
LLSSKNNLKSEAKQPIVAYKATQAVAGRIILGVLATRGMIPAMNDGG